MALCAPRPETSRTARHRLCRSARRSRLPAWRAICSGRLRARSRTNSRIAGRRRCPWAAGDCDSRGSVPARRSRSKAGARSRSSAGSFRRESPWGRLYQVARCRVQRPQGPKRGLGARFAPRHEVQRSRVHAIAQMRWRRTVGKYVPQMGVTARAKHLFAVHPEAAVHVNGHVLFGDRLPKARPSGAGFEFRLGIEQNRTAADTFVEAVFMVIEILAGEGPFRALVASHFKLLRSQLLPPHGVRFFYLFHFHDSFLSARGVKLGDAQQSRLMLTSGQGQSSHRDAAEEPQESSTVTVKGAGHFASPFTSSGNSL